MRPRDVARIFDVEVSTVVEWARIGKIPAIRTPGGQQYRFRTVDVVAMLEPLTTVGGDGHGLDSAKQRQEST
ncbi:helix-turn-helix domain-containing protein [Nonomuraea sp. PA05]|uniref:helix-turn-helix domain-containing protein n=1 Tax=Nonomuraea sp. PA05 TaxID=2604466 RepID=UPI0011D519E6|nr:helix-turn-helix domain-containing protein [Nonomuraea sp. PA05]TYB69777.1 helix-turn-helix domain-containing protein [Nonomuraea sp. PA05]